MNLFSGVLIIKINMQKKGLCDFTAVQLVVEVMEIFLAEFIIIHGI